MTGFVVFPSLYSCLVSNKKLSEGIIRPDRENDYPISYSTKVDKEWSYKFTLQYAFVLCTGTNLSLPIFSL